jgi:hypothetical protein
VVVSAAPSHREAATRLTLPKWSVWGLLASWVVYWCVLAAVTAGPAGWAVFLAHVLHRHGTVTLSYTGGLLLPALLIAGPPLLLALLWIATRPKVGD